MFSLKKLASCIRCASVSTILASCSLWSVAVAQEPPPTLEQEDLGAVFASIADSEYEIRWQEGRKAYMAPNRAQNLRFQFRDNGFLATPRDLKLARHDWSLDLTVESFGRVGALAQPRSADWTIGGKRAQARSENFAIIYENSKASLRQDFSIASRPAGSGKLTVNLSVRAMGAKARLTADGSGGGIHGRSRCGGPLQ